jgi:excisionase family DNA binding protein
MAKLLTVKEVADQLQVCDETVYRMIRQKELKAVKVRGRIRVTSAAVEEYIKEQEG